MASRAPRHRTLVRFLGREAVVGRFGANVVDEARQTSKRLAIGGDAGVCGARRRFVSVEGADPRQQSTLFERCKHDGEGIGGCWKRAQ
jgi:hypothetical protein